MASGITLSIDIPVNTTGLSMYLDAGAYPGSGSTLNDITSNGFNATLVNNPTYSGLNGGYFTFVPASVQYATITGAPLTTTSYTKQIWFRFNATADNNLISSDIGGHYIFTSGTNRIYAGHTNWTGFPTTYQSTATFSNNVWYNLAVTFDTTNGMAIYINGSLDSTYTAQKTAPTGGQCNLACYAAGGNLLAGRIAQALIYSRVLSLAEIQQNYNNTKSRFGL